MATFKEFISPIVKANKKEELLEIVNNADRIVKDIDTVKIITGNGTATVGVDYSYMHDKSTDKKSVCPSFAISLVTTDDSTDNEISMFSSEKNTKKLINALLKKLAEIKVLNAYTKPLREM